MGSIIQHMTLSCLLSLDLEKYKTIKKSKHIYLFNKNYLNQYKYLEEILNHNFNLLNLFIDLIYNRIQIDDDRKHILYFLKWVLELQINILSAFSHNNYLVMLTLIRVHIENLFHILWMSYNWWSIKTDTKSGIVWEWDSFLYKDSESKKFEYSKFLEKLLWNNEKRLQRDLFWFDFLSKYVHWSWLYSIWRHLNNIWKMSQKNYNEFYSNNGRNYLLFLQWSSLFLLKELFNPTKELFSEYEEQILNLDMTITFLESSINELDVQTKQVM